MARQSRIFRIFISSTFGDLKAEREALQLTVFPKLRELCATHGCRFQAIDLRWGVSEEAALDQQTMLICLEELRRCQRTTPRPNFVILMGQRYGWRPLPPHISSQEFHKIEKHIAAADRSLLNEWYRPDENALPSRHYLQPRRDKYEVAQRWATIESRLHSALAEAARAAGFPASMRFKYEAAATHQEIEAGALKTENPEKHVFGFFRTIDDLPSEANEFVDLDAHGRPDTEAQQRLIELKATLHQLLPNNIREYSTTWAGNGAGNTHLDQLCSDMFSELEQVIRAEIEDLEKIDALADEIDAQSTFAVDRRRFFTGRAKLLKKIAGHVRSNNSRPLMLHGESGSGKSAAMAQASFDCANELSSGVTVVRFIGATPATTDVRTLLDSVCRQIDRDYGQVDAVIPGDYRELIAAFRERLALATAEKPLVIFLDALDQLSDLDRGRNLMWLPDELPPHARLVVSTLPSECLDILAKKLPSRNQAEVQPMFAGEGKNLLRLWLTEAQRKLQPAQEQLVHRKFLESGGLPLYLKLAFEEARRWSSWNRTEDETLPVDVIGIIGQLFDRLSLETNHGETLVGRSLGYLAASRNGLTEDELLDVLSRDRDVIADFKQRSPKSPTVAGLPFINWSRLFADVEPYLAQRSGDGASLLSFYHRQLGEEAKLRFLSGKDKSARHEALAEYFAAQTAAGWGRRALSELAWQQIQSERWRDLEATLTNLDFLEAKCKAGGTYDLVADFDNAARAKLPAYVRERISPFARFIKANAHVLARRPELLCQLAANEPDRTVPRRAAQEKLASTKGDRSWLRWVNKPQTPSPCLMVLGHVDFLNACAVSPDGSRLVSVGNDRAVHVWDAATGVELLTMFGHRTAIGCCAYSPDGSCVATGGYDGALKLWDPRTGVELKPPEGHENQIEYCTFSNDSRWLLSTANDNTLRIWDVPNRKEFQVVRLAETAMGAAFSPDCKSFVVGDQRGVLKLWGLKSPKPLKELKVHDAEIMGCFFSPSGRWMFSTSQDKTFKRWKSDFTGEPLVFTGHTDRVWTVCVSEKRNLVASASGDQTVKLWDLQTGYELATLTGHTDEVLSCAFLPGDDRLVTSSWDATIRIWDVSRVGRSRRKRRTVKVEVQDKAIWLSCGYSHDGKMLAAGSEDDLRLWDAATGSLRQVMGGHPDYVRNAKFSPDDRWLVTSASRELYRWTVGETEPLELRKHRNLVSGCAISPDGKEVLSSSEDRTFRIADAEGGKMFRVLSRDKSAFTCCAAPDSWRVAAAGTKDGRMKIVRLKTGKELFEIQAHADEVTTIAFSADGSRLASGSMDSLVKIWNVSNGKLITVLTGHSSSILQCFFSPDGRRLATLSRDQTSRIWDLGTFKCLRTLVGHAFQAGGYSPDGSRLLTGSYDGTLRIWNATTGSEMAMLSGFRNSVAACAVSNDGSLIASASHFRALILRDGESGRQSRRLAGHAAEVLDCTFSPDSKALVSASADATLRLWNPVTGRCDAVLKGHEGPVQSCAFSPDGKLIVSGSRDRTLKLWEAQTGIEVATLKGHRDWAQRVIFSPDGRLIASGGLDKTIKVWDPTGKLKANLTGHGDAVNLCAFSSNSRFLLSGSGDGTLKVWNVARRTERFHFRGHTGAVRACAFSPLESLAVSGGMDTTVRLWNLQNGEGMILGEHESWVLSCAFSPTGQWLVTGANDGFVKLWDVPGRRLDSEYSVGAPVRCLRWHPSGIKFVVGDEEGGIHVLQRQ